jgi:hypothetical protein
MVEAKPNKQASIKKQAECNLLASFTYLIGLLSTLKMEAVRSSE